MHPLPERLLKRCVLGNPRRLGVQAARNRYKTMAAGHSLPEYKQEMLKLTARLMIHALNASSRIMEAGEETQDERPRELLAKLLELQREVRANFAFIFDGEAQGDDPFAGLRGEK